MASVEKVVIRKYNLELTDKEFYALLCLMGRTSYADFKQAVNERYSVRLGRATDTEDFEIPTYDEYTDLYIKFDENK